MQAFAPFRPNRSAALLALICAAFAGELAAAAAARVDFSTGSVTVSGRDGPMRPLRKGAELNSGDTVRTNDGRAQIRFTDGSYISLQPGTEFGINDYHYAGKSDGNERSFFNLVKGAMRTVTGAVGKANRDAYRISTPTATIGIRGTGGVIQVQPDGSTLVIGTSGIWSLSNAAGAMDVPAGIAALAPKEPKAPPRETRVQPAASAAPLPVREKPLLPEEERKPITPIFVQGEERSTATLPKSLFTPLQSGAGYSAVFAYTSTVLRAGATITPGGKADAAFGGRGELLKAAVGSGFALDSGVHADFGTDGILAWGRWTGAVVANGSPEKYGDSQGLHYVIGLPTPVLPTAGGGAYMLIGATSPTYSDGSTPAGKFDGSLKVGFTPTGADISANFNVTMPDGAYNMNGSTRTTGAGFTLTPTVTGTAGKACTSACTGSMEGFFAGLTAERAGVGYQINDPTTNRSVLGAAAFSRQ